MNPTNLIKLIYKARGYTLSELFKIRDACLILSSFNLEDKDLLNEVNKYIRQKEGVFNE